jgi:hypothetical protein
MSAEAEDEVDDVVHLVHLRHVPPDTIHIQPIHPSSPCFSKKLNQI